MVKALLSLKKIDSGMLPSNSGKQDTENNFNEKLSSFSKVGLKKKLNFRQIAKPIHENNPTIYNPPNFCCTPHCNYGGPYFLGVDSIFIWSTWRHHILCIASEINASLGSKRLEPKPCCGISLCDFLCGDFTTCFGSDFDVGK